MTTLLNLNWDHTNADLFLGDSLGIADYVRVAHPELERLALLQRSQFWTETEISLEADKKQWPNLPREIQEITLLNLAWQTQTDSFISRAPEAAIMPLVSRPELEGMLKQLSYFEDLHSRAYSNIIRNVLTDPAEFIDSVTKNQEAFAR
ncbi:ribonucleotide-diphosphate reductase subunit beta, partial [Luteibacter rhizovicinus]|uniref:ribonucleotide-diphosphate reductase subunit beta n=1 Tax=Luteibacter rhizovicinus TaxID=242606 RepID=UPI00062D9617